MYKIIKKILPLIAVAALTGCDDIAADDRYQELETIDAKRTVLLEEYTGQLCVNCPTAHAVIEQLEEQYGDRFIAVSFHCGGSAFSIQANDPLWEGITGLATPLSEEYGKAAGVTNALPKGRVDRIGSIDNPPQWADAVRRQIVIDSDLELTLTGALAEDRKSASVKVSMLTPETIAGAKLQLWVVESGIKALQMMPDGSINMDYVHNNVFRADVNGFGGEAVSLQPGVYTDKEYTVAITDDWVAENLSVVAVAYTSGEVLQAARIRFSNIN